MQATVKTANAQTIKADQLVGTWTGSITTVYGELKDETPISVNFEDGYTVTLTMLVSNTATYTVENNTILIFFRGSQNEPLTLENVRLKQDSMVAEGHFPSDHSSISNRLTLFKTANEGRVAPTARTFCGKNEVHPNVQLLFDKYQVRCPINVLENSRWYNSPFFTAFLADLIKEILRMSADPLSSEELRFSKVISEYRSREFRDYLREYPNGQFANLARHMLRRSDPARVNSASNYGVVITVYDERSVKIIQEFIKPILEDPNHLTFQLYREPGAPYPYMFRVSELKPSFRENNFTNLNKVWTEIVNAAAPLGINLDSKTITEKEQTRTISQTVPRRITEPGGYIYFEYVTVTMISKGPDDLMVDLKSKIIKRKGYSSLLHSIECDLNGGSSTVCSEQPYMKAIIRALTGRD